MGKFGLIGEHLGHSYSKSIHRRFGDYEYDYLETSSDGLPGVLKNEEYSGFNVTIPYKKSVMRYLDELSPLSRNIGAVNTIVRRDGRLLGYNTDYYGFRYMLRRNKIDVTGKKCLVLGSGGASAVVSQALKDLSADEVVVVSRKGENNYDNIGKHFDSEIIVNATPVGMYPDNGRSLVNVDNFSRLRGAVDLIYNPDKTKFILDAIAKGVPCCGGISMLVAQAKQASELFQDKYISEDDVEEAIFDIRSEELNIILIGMPGAGKTYLGRKIAEKQGREFVDIDDLIIEREGMPIEEIFDSKGEEYFRAVESEIFRDTCKRQGLVIATGGGIVKRKINYNYARQNGRIIWVKRDLNKLEIKGRPLSKSAGVEALYEERKDIYESWSDYFIDNNQEFN